MRIPGIASQCGLVMAEVAEVEEVAPIAMVRYTRRPGDLPTRCEYQGK